MRAVLYVVQHTQSGSRGRRGGCMGGGREQFIFITPTRHAKKARLLL